MTNSLIYLRHEQYSSPFLPAGWRSVDRCCVIPWSSTTRKPFPMLRSKTTSPERIPQRKLGHRSVPS